MQANGAVITRVHSISSVGFDARSTAAAIRAGISALRTSDDYFDSNGEPITYSELPIIEDVTDDQDLVDRIGRAAAHGLDQLLADGCPDTTYSRVHLIAAVAPLDRIDVRYEGEQQELLSTLSDQARKVARTEVVSEAVCDGHAAALSALQVAQKTISEDANEACIIVAFDSLLDERILDGFELDYRLLSASPGRNQAFAPSEAVALFMVESWQAAVRRSRRPLACVSAAATAREPNPFVSGRASRAEGLSRSVAEALEQARCSAQELDAVLADLNGEFHRSREWALTEIRCLGSGDRELWHPADCMGDTGAASAGLLVNLAAMWISDGLIRRCLCVASDDFGACGAAILSSLPS